MSGSRGYRVERMGRARLALAAGQNLAVKRHLIYAVVEADLTVPRRLLREHREEAGERLSLTAYVVTCVASALAEFPELNAFRRGHSLVFIEEVIIEVLVERMIGGQPAVGYLPIRNADTKSLREVHDAIRATQASTEGTIMGQRWLCRMGAGVHVAVVDPVDAAEYPLGARARSGGGQQRRDRHQRRRVGIEPRGRHSGRHHWRDQPAAATR